MIKTEEREQTQRNGERRWYNLILVFLIVKTKYPKKQVSKCII